MHDLVDLPRLRRRTIAERLARGEAVASGALAAEFGVSEDAVRRDLRALAAEGRCRRVYGGALPLSPADGPFARRIGEDTAEKHALARAALPLLAPGATVFFDAGTTALALADVVPPGLGLTIVTNAVPIAAALLPRTDLTLFLVGGRVDPTVGGAVDARAVAELARFRIDLAVLGACAVSIDEGLAGFDAADVDFKRALLATARRSLLLATGAKLETAAPHRIGPLAALDTLIVPAAAADGFVAAARAAGPDVIRAASVDAREPTP